MAVAVTVDIAVLAGVAVKRIMTGAAGEGITLKNPSSIAAMTASASCRGHSAGTSWLACGNHFTDTY
jgi:hypothetical protein